jgi:hypothetical protein
MFVKDVEASSPNLRPSPEYEMQIQKEMLLCKLPVPKLSSIVGVGVRS